MKFNKVSLFQINQTLKSRHNPRMSDVKVSYLCLNVLLVNNQETMNLYLVCVNCL